jgi:FMN phosphatase YigB (HAD superfamily)
MINNCKCSKNLFAAICRIAELRNGSAFASMRAAGMGDEMAIELVAFDVGETLMDERGLWARWATWLGVEAEELREAIRETVRHGEHHRMAFARVAPGVDITAAQAARIAAGDEPGFRPDELFKDVLPCLQALRRGGAKIAIAGNTSQRTEQVLADAGIVADFIASAERWGLSKPDPAFFRRIAERASVPAGRIVYVGDRLDNDVLPAQEAGMIGVFVRRGLWGEIQRYWPQASRADYTIDGLGELPPIVASLQAPANSILR